MPATERTNQLADAALGVLASNGLRGVTHRAVDQAAGLPQGSCSNCFRTRDELIIGLGQRVFERITPDDDYLHDRSAQQPTKGQWVRLMIELVERAQDNPDLFLALMELRLEATRRPALREPLTAIIQGGLEADVDFHKTAGLAGGRKEIVLLHLAIGGLITELLTLPNALGITDPAPLIEDLVERIIYRSD